jgi:REP element-mobilizing transposase RayT
MARPLRIEFPGAVYHVTSRGNARATIYADDDDRTTFLALLTRVVQRYHWLCHAYGLTDNHYHLVLETPEGNLSQGMRQVNGLYTQWYNRRQSHVGHVFQGRYKAILIERDSYLVTVCRYVVLHPVCAGMVQTAQEYGWSSYGATAGDGEGPVWLCTDWLLTPCGRDRAEAQQHSRRFVAEGVAHPSPWQDLHGQILLGHPTFVEAMRPRLQAAHALLDVPRVQRYADRPALETMFHGHQTLSKPERNRRIVLAHQEYGYTLAAIGRALGLHYTTISKVVSAQGR